MDDYFAPEDLDAELVDYLVDLRDMKALKHPLVFSVPYIEPLNKQLNAQLVYKRHALERALDESDWHSYVFLHERPYRIEAFRTICADLNTREYWTLLGVIWSDTENLHEWGDVETLFIRPGRKTYFMDADERRELALLGEVVEIFRGHQVINQMGWSWTTDNHKARWFAKRYYKDGKVTTAHVDKSKILAYFSGRGESEIVVNPKDVLIDTEEQIN